MPEILSNSVLSRNKKQYFELWGLVMLCTFYVPPPGRNFVIYISGLDRGLCLKNSTARRWNYAIYVDISLMGFMDISVKPSGEAVLSFSLFCSEKNLPRSRKLTFWNICPGIQECNCSDLPKIYWHLNGNFISPVKEFSKLELFCFTFPKDKQVIGNITLLFHSKAF